MGRQTLLRLQLHQFKAGLKLLVREALIAHAVPPKRTIQFINVNAAYFCPKEGGVPSFGHGVEPSCEPDPRRLASVFKATIIVEAEHLEASLRWHEVCEFGEIAWIALARASQSCGFSPDNKGQMTHRLNERSIELDRNDSPERLSLNIEQQFDPFKKSLVVPRHRGIVYLNKIKDLTKLGPEVSVYVKDVR
jgi:hypothetical protein